MKNKFFASTLLSLASLSAFAMPASTDDLIKALVASDALSEALARETNIGKVEISRVHDYRAKNTVMSLCGEDALSRSGAVLQVDVIFARGPGMSAAVYSATEYFVTRGSPSDLKRCNAL